MSRESAFIARLAAIARDPAARGLKDDGAVLPMGERDLVLTHDMIAEGVHYLPDDPPADVAWKLVAVNLSDLAAKGAKPVAMLLGYALGPDEAWDAAFVEGLRQASEAFGAPLLGGDTIRSAGPRTLGLTAIGAVAPGGAPSRSGAKAGDALWVTGRIGTAGLGLGVALGKRPRDDRLLAAYRRPIPRLAEGAAIALRVHAMADVSDGLLLDVSRMADASGIGVRVDLDSVPFDPAVGPGRDDRLAAATAGDDYELLFAAADTFAPEVPATRIGCFVARRGLVLRDRGVVIAHPDQIGYEHS